MATLPVDARHEPPISIVATLKEHVVLVDTGVPN
jgi:hypothetical protein